LNWSTNNFWFLDIIQWMLKTSNAHYTSEKNMKICFLLLVFVQD
jgi:hypothetical protein